MDFETVNSELTSLDDERMGKLATLCKSQIALEDLIGVLQGELKQANIDLRDISEDKLPAIMDEFGVSEVTMDDGSKITIKQYYGASIPKDKTKEAFSWLIDEGYGGLIKNTVTASFSRGRDEDAKLLNEELIGRGEETKTKTWVEPMTLKKFVQEETDKGVDLPYDLFGIYIGKQTKIKRR